MKLHLLLGLPAMFTAIAASEQVSELSECLQNCPNPINACMEDQGCKKAY